MIVCRMVELWKETAVAISMLNINNLIRNPFESMLQAIKDTKLRVREHHKFKGIIDDEVPMVLVGNKCDLERDRAVDKGTGRIQENCTYIEASAKEQINVSEVSKIILNLKLFSKLLSPRLN